jgi:hypothetical protein
VKASGAILGLKLAGLAGLSGRAFVWWLRAPVLDSVGIQVWCAFALLGAAAIGGIGVLVNVGWLRVSIAVVVGLVSGAAWAEVWLTDVRVGSIDSLVAGVSNYGQGFLAPCVAAALLGAFATQVVLRRATWHPRFDGDG